MREVTRKYANERQLDDKNGVAVTGLSAGYPAGKAEIGGGDIIIAVNQKPVANRNVAVGTKVNVLQR